MTPIEFENYLEGQLKRIKDVLASKAGEYATDDDRFHNFILAADLDGETPERALWGMLKKHIISVRDLVDRLNSDPGQLIIDADDVAIWQEKCGDMVNYTLLLLGLIYDRLELSTIHRSRREEENA